MRVYLGKLSTNYFLFPASVLFKLSDILGFIYDTVTACSLGQINSSYILYNLIEDDYILPVFNHVSDYFEEHEMPLLRPWTCTSNIS
jgi:hypothetical protein